MTKSSSIKKHIYKLPLFAICLILAGVSLIPFFIPGHASAYGQISNRSLTISSGVPSKTGVTYTFVFRTPTITSAIQSMKFIACTTAVATYPEGDCSSSASDINLSGASYSSGAQAGFTDATAFGIDGTGATAGALPGENCTPAANEVCLTRTSATTDTGGSTTAKTIAFTGVVNPTVANTAFYIGIYTFSSANYTGLIDFGATASAVTATLQTDAAVAEVLQFCVGSSAVNDSDTTLIANDCSTVSGTSVDIGTLDTSAINVSPISTDGGNGDNGVAMVRSNAGNGVAISYDAIQASTGANHLGTLRISGQTCNTIGDPGVDADGNTKTDACINAAGAVQGAFTPGQERFGMTVAGVNHLGTTSYTCVYDNGGSGANTCHLEPATNYLGKGGLGTEQFGSDNGFAWVENGSSTTIASSAASSVPQVDDEALVLKFAATPSITTPFGRYSVQTDFIAVPTY